MATSMEKGTATFTDFHRKIYTISPAAKQNIAVLVPDWNIPQITAAEINKKKILALFNLLVIPQIMKAVAAAAA